MSRSRDAEGRDAEDERALDAFPAVLRELVTAEVAAGNAVTEVGCGFPAPPCGAWARLARPVATRPRRSAAGVVFRARDWPGHSFEWSDAAGHFFLLEPRLASPRQPSMDEIRGARAPQPGPRLPEPPALPPLAPGEYRVIIDYRGELVTYEESGQERGRFADVTCTWGPQPILRRGSLTGWRTIAGQGASPMSAAERDSVLARIVDHLRRQGMPAVEFED